MREIRKSKSRWSSAAPPWGVWPQIVHLLRPDGVVKRSIFGGVVKTGPLLTGPLLATSLSWRGRTCARVDPDGNTPAQPVEPASAQHLGRLERRVRRRRARGVARGGDPGAVRAQRRRQPRSGAASLQEHDAVGGAQAQAEDAVQGAEAASTRGWARALSGVRAPRAISAHARLCSALRPRWLL